MQPRTRFSIWYYLTVLGVILALDSLLFSGPGVPQIAYSTFLDRVQKDQVERVVITQNQIYGVMKPPDAPPAPPAVNMARSAMSRFRNCPKSWSERSRLALPLSSPSGGRRCCSTATTTAACPPT